MDEYPYDLGSYSLPVTTVSQDAQLWFDRGLNWTYGYNHEEAVRCFARASEADPTCAMAHWGKAYASGPNYNMPWHLYDEFGRARALAASHDAMEAAMAARDGASDVERALIEALPARYPARDPIPDMTPWNNDYADAMRAVHQRFPDSLPVRTVLVEAILNKTPWKMWDLFTGQPGEGADAEEARRLCEEAFADDPAAMTHPGLLHVYVHLMEMSPVPEVALKAGDALRGLLPDAGHLNHMPTHIDVQCGDYQSVVRWNQVASDVDRLFFEREGAFNRYTGYRAHNYHFAIYGAMFLGQMAPALEAADALEHFVPTEVLQVESPPMADFFESYRSFKPHVLIRFGRWREAIALPLPEDQTLFATKTATTLYGRTLGHAALGEVDAAEDAEAEFLAAVDRIPEGRRQHNNKVSALMEVSKAMARGEILYRKGDFAPAFAALREAVALDDALNYDEPWGTMQPVRHALGALLFEQGHIEDAEAAYREDLGLGGSLPRAQVHPDNVWALRGLHDCLQARGETCEIEHISRRLSLVEARADSSVRASCFCAQAAMA
jgi:tetratricopeptide (TPR) repeat protein